MEIRQVIRRQYLVTFDEEEAQDVRDFLDGLQEEDYEKPFMRNRVDAKERQAEIKQALTKLKEALQLVPSGHSDHDTRHL